MGLTGVVAAPEPEVVSGVFPELLGVGGGLAVIPGVGGGVEVSLVEVGEEVSGAFAVVSGGGAGELVEAAAAEVVGRVEAADGSGEVFEGEPGRVGEVGEGVGEGGESGGGVVVGYLIGDSTHHHRHQLRPNTAFPQRVRLPAHESGHVV